MPCRQGAVQQDRIIRQKGNEEFQVDSTPSFFVNGKRVKGEVTIENFDIALGEAAGEKRG